jgi:hypothetical protein
MPTAEVAKPEGVHFLCLYQIMSIIYECQVARKNLVNYLMRIQKNVVTTLIAIPPGLATEVALLQTS